MCVGCVITGFALNALCHTLPNSVGVHGVSKIQCAETCSDRPSCNSFFYFPSSQSCFLSHLYVEDSVVSSNGTRFYTRPLPGCITKDYNFVAKLNVCVLDQSRANMSWYEAESYCKNNHGMLMKAHNSIRHQYFLEIGKKNGYMRLHIGGKNFRIWRWVDGSRIENDHWRSNSQTVFASFINTRLNYCFCNGAYTWADTTGNSQHGFLCESTIKLYSDRSISSIWGVTSIRQQFSTKAYGRDLCL